MTDGGLQIHDGIIDSNDRRASLYALAIIIDDLKNDDPQCRLNGISKLPTVALAIGPDRTRSELLPFLKEATNDEDEILLSIATQMSSFLTYIGGIQYVNHLIPILENIMCVEENICRDEAVKSLNILIRQMNTEQVTNLIVPLFEKFYQMEMFTIKSSLCGLFTTTYEKLDKINIQERLCAIYKAICADEAPIVRRAAASKMKDIVPIILSEHVENEIAPAFLTMLNDDQDSVRVAVVEAFPEILGSIKNNEKLTNLLLNELSRLFKDKSWRIRFKIADTIASFHDIVNQEFVTNDIIPTYVSLLKDDEPEVRTSAAHRLYDFCSKLPHEQCSHVLLTQLIPCVKVLVDDMNMNVKSAIATVLLKLSDFLTKSDTVTILIPLFHAMLKDSIPDVRLNVLSNLENINKVVGAAELSNTLLPTIIELADDSKWRVRLAVINYIPSLAKQFGLEFFDSKLISLCLGWLTDPVFAIRDEAGKVLCDLVNNFGNDWAIVHILPKLHELAEHINYLRRMTALFTINSLLKTQDPITLISQFLPIVFKLCIDRVPNVRFNCAITLQNISQILLPSSDNDLINEIKSKLGDMVDDHDIDVQYYTSKAFDSINSCFKTTKTDS